jgi:hypothetical protein
MATCVSYLTLSPQGDEKITYLHLVLGCSKGEMMEHRVAAGSNTELAISDELRQTRSTHLSRVSSSGEDRNRENVSVTSSCFW